MGTPANHKEASQAICLLGEEGRQVLGVKNQEHNCSKKVTRGEKAEGKPDCFESGFLGEGELEFEKRCRGGKCSSRPSKDGGGNPARENGQVRGGNFQMNKKTTQTKPPDIFIVNFQILLSDFTAI